MLALASRSVTGIFYGPLLKQAVKEGLLYDYLDR